MSYEITTYTQSELIKNLDEGNALIVIRNNPKIYPHFYTLSDDEKIVSIQAIMIKCYQMRHITNLDYIKFDSRDLVDEINNDKRFRDMSVEEIKTAMKNGAKDKYGECKGLTVAFFIKCLNSYIKENKQNYIDAVRLEEKNKKREYEEMMLKNTKLRLEESKRRASMERAAKELLYNTKQ